MKASYKELLIVINYKVKTRKLQSKQPLRQMCDDRYACNIYSQNGIQMNP